MMGCSVREVQRRVDSAEYELWQAYWQMEPWGWEQRLLAANVKPKYKSDHSVDWWATGRTQRYERQTTAQMQAALSIFAKRVR